MNTSNRLTLALVGSMLLAPGAVPMAFADDAGTAGSDTVAPAVPEGGRGVRGNGGVDRVPEGGRGMNSEAGAEASEAEGMVDVNTASKTTLQSQLGLSEDDAQTLVDYRSENGRIETQAQLAEIGLSEEAVEKMKGRAAFAQ